MRTVGEILKGERLKLGVELEAVARKTKIKKHYLEALERDDYQALPSAISARGFIKNYAGFLNLSPEPFLGAFRRDFKASQKKRIVLPGTSLVVGKSIFNWGPKLTLVTVILIALVGLLAYLGYQYFSLVREPRIEISQPFDSQEVLERKVVVSGKTSPDATVTVNGNLASLSETGEFHLTLDLLPGENRIMVEATNRLGRKSRLERTVLVKEPG